MRSLSRSQSKPKYTFSLTTGKLFPGEGPVVGNVRCAEYKRDFSFGLERGSEPCERFYMAAKLVDLLVKSSQSLDNSDLPQRRDYWKDEPGDPTQLSTSVEGFIGPHNFKVGLETFPSRIKERGTLIRERYYPTVSDTMHSAEVTATIISPLSFLRNPRQPFLLSQLEKMFHGLFDKEDGELELALKNRGLGYLSEGSSSRSYDRLMLGS
jgi:hypothetical protein